MKRFMLLALALGGCMTMRKDAATAYTEGDYIRSVDLYDQILNDDPKDSESVKKRDDARMAALRQLLFRAEDARTQQHMEEAGTDLEQLLEHRDAWKVTLDPRMTAPLATEISEQSAYLVATIGERAKNVSPLAAEALEHQHGGLFARPEFTATRAQVVAEINAEGAARCETLPSDTPYLAWIAGSYCTHFGSPREIATPPNLRAGLEIDGGVHGETQPETIALKQALQAAFNQSVWYSPNAAMAANATLGGSLTSTFSSKQVQLTKRYTVSVPYTDTEEDYEPYDESYTDYETQTEQVPTSTYNSDTGSMDTTYTTQTTTVPVTKTRTSYHWVTETVTKYRDEDRQFDYNAIERDGTYKADLAVTVDHDLSGPVTAKATYDDRDQGYDHDVTNSEAGVSPSRANLMSAEGFAAQEQHVLADTFTRELDEKYLALYCTQATYTPEQAAACAYLDPTRTPEGARTVLHSIYGNDEPFLATMLKR